MLTPGARIQEMSRAHAGVWVRGILNRPCEDERGAGETDVAIGSHSTIFVLT